MLKENWRSITRIERVGDFLLVLICFFAAYYGRDSLIYWNQKLAWGLPFGGEELAPIKDYFIVLIVALIGYMFMLQVLGAYSSMRLSSSWRLLRISLIGSVVVFFFLAAVLFLLKLDLSRSFIVLFCSLVGLAITAERYVVLEFLRFWRRRGKNFRNLLICGVGEQALRITQEIKAKPELGIRILGFVDLLAESNSDTLRFDGFRDAMRRSGMRRIGRMILGREAFENRLRRSPIDEVIFTDVVEVMPIVEEMVLVCAEQGIRTTIAADLFSIGLVKSGISYFGTMPLIHFQTPPGDKWELTFKRWIDLALAGLLLVLLSPLFLLIALCIKVNSRGPVFFVQQRVGLNGRLFPLYKFRSMQAGAERQLEDLRASNEMTGPVFKMKNDPRVTLVGSFLRRFSLDELPQLWNVVRGHMSLVGPRPPVPGEVSVYERKDRRRLSMRPGMTCIWQVSGRNEIKEFENWVKMDLEYIDNWSLALDFSLLIRTIPAVLLGTGAR
ncbi:MAG: sugar transferase [Bdellovibrionales bacterium]|nr:sugar transferase [Bdellovibrionales bacterium]